jgi:hypothetical protein
MRDCAPFASSEWLGFVGRFSDVLGMSWARHRLPGVVSFQPRPPGMSAKRMFETLQRHNRRIELALGKEQFHLRAPFWWLHLPNGREVKVKSFTYEGPLMVFETFWSTPDNVQRLLMAPEAVVLSVKTEDKLDTSVADHVPPEFLEPREDEENDLNGDDLRG